MRRVSFSDRARYAFDNTMSAGPAALIGWLAVLSVVLILIISVLVVAANQAPLDEVTGQPVHFSEVMWMSMLRTLDPGTMGGDVGWGFRVLMLGVTLGGIFIVATLIGVLTSSIEARLGELRKGRSFVVEQDHTVILGWSTQVFSIVSELVIANANRRNACIAILADKDKVEMEDEIRSRVPNTANTRIVCRTGSPIDPADLDLVNPAEARSIIVLSAEADDPDSQVIKTILALLHNPHHPAAPYHIVAEIRRAENLEVARMVGRDKAQLILVNDLIARIAVQTCRQSGLSVVYTELLDFGGDEIYFYEEPALVGTTFGEALFAYEDSTLIGLARAGDGVVLNPPMDTTVGPGDQVIAISKDDDTIRLSGMIDLRVDESAIQHASPPNPAQERTLILGWNQCGPMIVRELDHYVAPGSEVIVVAESDEAEEAIGIECAGLANTRVSFRRGNTSDRRTLDLLSVTDFDHIITLSYSSDLPAQEADACTLMTLLHLRDISEHSNTQLPIVSEMLDMRNRELAEITRADDFIVSDKLGSLMLSQVSENKGLMAVFTDLFDPEGSELYLKPASQYVVPGRPVNFYTVVEAARRRGEVAIGYRLLDEANDASRSYGVRVNPDKSGSVTFGTQDKIIVLAEQ